MILIIKEMNFLYQRKILVKLKWKAKFVSMFFVMKTNWLIPFKNFKNLKIICCLYLMKINYIMCTSKILTDLYLVKQKIKTKNTFAKVAYSVLVIKIYWQSKQKLV